MRNEEWGMGNEEWGMRNRGLCPVVCLVLMLAVVAGCAILPIKETIDFEGVSGDILLDVLGLLSEDDFPRLDGSTATKPLGEALAALIMGKDRAACKEFADFSGTNEAYIRLADGEADLLLVYEMPSEADEYVRDQASSFEIASIGMDALIFMVSTLNPVDNLTTQQIIDIYAWPEYRINYFWAPHTHHISGKITNWRTVGGKDAPILAFQRNNDSGSHTLMKKLVMGETPLAPAQKHLIVYSMSEILNVIADYDNGPNSIGYNVYYYVAEMEKDPHVKILSVDGVAPGNDTIASGKYPFVNDFYAVIRATAKPDSPERLLFRWLQTVEGQLLIEAEGYVALHSQERI